MGYPTTFGHIFLLYISIIIIVVVEEDAAPSRRCCHALKDDKYRGYFAKRLFRRSKYFSPPSCIVVVVFIVVAIIFKQLLETRDSRKGTSSRRWNEWRRSKVRPGLCHNYWHQVLLSLPLPATPLPIVFTMRYAFSEDDFLFGHGPTFYRCLNRSLASPVLIKRIIGGAAKRKIDQCEKEVNYMKSLNQHPGIPRIIDSFAYKLDFYLI